MHSAKVAWYAQRLDAFGLHRPEPGIDMAVVRERKRAMVRDLVEVHEKRFAASHVELIRGQGTFTGPRTLLVELEEGGTRLLSAGLVIVSTGSRAAIPDLPGLRASRPLTHVEELELDRLPEHLVILGGGYVGLEFAQAMVRFGSRVTLIDQHERLLPHEDEDVAVTLQGLLAAEGIQFRLGTMVESVSGRSGDFVSVRIRTGTEEEVINGTHILVAAGRLPNTDGIGLRGPALN